MTEEMRPISKERVPTRDGFAQLDSINFRVVKEQIKGPGALGIAADILADVKNSEIAKLIDKPAVAQNGKVPGSFDEMMDASTGTAWQRLQKWYFKVGNPEKNIKFLESIGVDKYRNSAKWIMLDLLKRRGYTEQQAREGKNTNYTLADRSLNSLLDFATNQTTLNEIAHLVLAAQCVLLAGVDTLSGESPVVGGTFFILNLYCVLAQRYTRSKLSIAIDRVLQKHPKFDAEKYKNALGIKLPQSNSL